MPPISSLLGRYKINQVDLQMLLDRPCPLPIIDCRPVNAFIESHLIGATSIPCNELFERMHELPQRHVSLMLYGDEASLIQAIEFLISKGYQIPKVALWPEGLTGIREKPYIEFGTYSKQLWSPANIIQHFIDEHLVRLKSAKAGNREQLKGLDIACGSGRDMISLAQNGLDMTGLDYHSDALARANRLAQSNQLAISTIQLDLESSEDPLFGFEPESFHVICVLRYLHRPLLHKLDQLLAPGGMILYQTFMLGCENISSPKNPRFLLKPDELSSVFSSYRIWQDEIEILEDGRPVSAFIAQKALN